MWSPWYRNWITQRPPPTRVDLLNGLDRVEFSYWDPACGCHRCVGECLGWNDRAELVRLRLVFPAGAATKWPEIIAATEREPRVF